MRVWASGSLGLRKLSGEGGEFIIGVELNANKGSVELNLSQTSVGFHAGAELSDQQIESREALSGKNI